MRQAGRTELPSKSIALLEILKRTLAIKAMDERAWQTPGFEHLYEGRRIHAGLQ